MVFKKVLINKDHYKTLEARAKVADAIERIKGIGTLLRISGSDEFIWSDGLNRVLQTNYKKTNLDDFFNYFPEPDKEKIKSFYEECKKTSRRKGEKFEIRTPDDFKRHIKVHVEFRNDDEILIVHDITKPVEEREELIYKANEFREQAIRDPLTGVLNRRGLYCEADKLQRMGVLEAGFLQIDMDNFKILNDTMGHLEGDKALKKLVDILRNNVRECDIISRYGGDEFSVLCPGINEESLDIIKKRIYSGRKPNDYFDYTIGGATGSLKNLDDLINNADKDLYRMKKKKKIN